MNALSRLPRLLLASTVALSSVALSTIAAAAAPPYVPTGGTATGQRMHKPITVTTPSTVCPAPATAGTKVASDPEEGGQVAHVADATKVEPLKAASDPEEGGQVVARTAKSKPSVSEMNVTKKADTASPTLGQSAPSSSRGACPSGQQ